MTKVNITLDPKKFDADVAEFRRALKDVADKFLKIVKQETPVSSGRSGPFRRNGGKHLRDSLNVRVRGDTISVVSNAPHFLPVLEGAKAHRIPKVGKVVMAFPNKSFLLKSLEGQRTIRQRRSRNARFGGGESLYTQFAKIVDHPGTDPNPFVKRAVRKLPALIRAELKFAK